MLLGLSCLSKLYIYAKDDVGWVKLHKYSICKIYIRWYNKCKKCDKSKVMPCGLLSLFKVDTPHLRNQGF